MHTGLLLFAIGAAATAGMAYGSSQDSAVVDLVITSHNPGCTALYLNYTDITRLTDLRPWHLDDDYSYTQDEMWYGVNITAAIWARDSNMTIPAILERPEVSSVATYSRVTPNSTETPTLLAWANNTNFEVDWLGIVPTRCGALHEHYIPALMDGIGWEGAGPGAWPVGPEPGAAESARSADDPEPDGQATAKPVPLTLDTGFDTRVDLESRIVYAGDLMGVEIRTTNYTAVWAYLKENGALVRSAYPNIVVGYIPPSLFGPLSIRDDIRSVNVAMLEGQEHYGTTNTEGLLDVNHPNVEQWHGLGHNGTNIRVGIIDFRFNLNTTTGDDLPAQANIVCYSPIHNQGCGDKNYQIGWPPDRAHGMGVAEIIMDMAPGVDLYLAAVDDAMLDTLHAAVDWLVGQNVDIISMSLRYPFEGPGDGTSPVTNSSLSAVDKAVRAGIVWVNSAGNYGNQQTWSTFDVQTVNRAGAHGSVLTTTWVDFDPGPGSDTYNLVQDDAGPGNPFTAIVEIRWSGGGELRLFRVNSTDPDWEGIRRYNEGEPAKRLTRFDVDSDIRIEIVGDKPDWIQMMLYSRDGAVLEHSTRDGGVNTPSDSANPGMLAVGAVNVTNNRNVAPYSSHGEHPSSNNSSDTRGKPDIYGASHITTDAYWNWLPSSLAGYNFNSSLFKGTSAAAPHVAGIAALTLDYHNDTLTPSQTTAYLKQHMDAQSLIAGLPALSVPAPNTTIPHDNPFQQIVLETENQVVHLGRASSVYTMAMRWDVDAVQWVASSSNTTVASIDEPRSLMPMRGVFTPVVWFDDVVVHPHNPGTTTITVNITDGTVHRSTSFEVTVTGNTHPAIYSIGTQHLNLTSTPHTIVFTAWNNDADPLEWRYVLKDHTYFDIHTPRACETKGPFEECELPSNTLTLTPTTTGDNAILYGVYDGRGGNDLDAVDVYVAPNTNPIHGVLPALTLAAGESATVQFQATDADGDAIIHMIPHAAHSEIAEAARPYHTSNQELLEAPANGTAPNPGLIPESASFGENGTVMSMSALKATPSGKMLRYVVNGTGGLPALPESVVSTYQYDRSSAPTAANLTLTLTGLSPGNTTITSTVRDVWGGYDTVNFTITVLPSAPNITLAGPTHLHILTNTTFTEPGYTATDREDGELTANVTVTGTINTSTPGTYHLTYDITDSDGNAATQRTRTIHVIPSSDFVTTWKTTKANQPVTIPVGGATNTYTTHWGDGTTSSNVTGDQTHTYDYPGTHTIWISGDLTRFYLDATPHQAHLLQSIEQWGSATWELLDFESASAMAHLASDAPDLSNMTDTSYMFSRAGSFNGDLSSWDVSSITNMTGMFQGATSFNGDISSWDVSGVTDMSHMFHAATSFNGDISSWNVSGVTNMVDMFTATYAFDQNLGSWYIIPDYPAANNNRTIAAKITAQNQFLDNQNVTYSLGSGGDSHLFEMDGSTLMFRTAPDPSTNKTTYTLTITSTGGFGSGNYRTLTIAPPSADLPSPANHPPTADAGPDRTIQEGSALTLTGMATDPDPGDTLTYQWSHDYPGNLTLSDDTSLTPTLTAPQVMTSNTTITFTLMVNDGQQTASDQMTLIITDIPPANHPPVADAGPDQAVIAGTIITLDGTASADPDGDTLTHQWSQTGGPSVSLSDATSPSPSFTAPASNATLVFSLIVNDGTISSPPDTVTVTVATQPAPSPRDLGEITLVSASPGEITATWDAPTETPKDYRISWARVGEPFLTFTNPSGNAFPTLSNYTITGLDEDAEYKLKARARYHQGGSGPWSEQYTITTTMAAPANHPPVANAGPDQTVTTQVTVTLDGTASADPDGDPLTYQWSQTGGQTIALSNVTGPTPTFIAPANQTTLLFSLTVRDGTADSTPDAVTINVITPANHPPTADAGPDRTIQEGSTLTLTGTATDPDPDDTLTYQWSHDYPGNLTLSGAASLSPSFTAPQVMTSNTTIITFTLMVNDGSATATDTTSVTITDVPPPSPVPTAPQNLAISLITNTTITLTWERPTDPSIDGYEIYSKTSNQTEFTRHYLVRVDKILNSPNDIMVTNLDPDTEYQFKMRYDNEHGWSAYSNIATGTTTGGSSPS